MKSVFADSFSFYAWINEGDAVHDKALEFSERTDLFLITTEWALCEVADGMARPPFREGVSDFFKNLWDDPYTRVLQSDPELFRAGLQVYSERNDKTWSLTDCISFVVMKRMGITEALTGDKHFVQAGFRALLLSPEESF